MNTDDIQTFRTKLADAGFEEHAENGSDSPEWVWAEGWNNGKCLSIRCYQRGVEVKVEDRLADQAARAKAAGRIEDKDIPDEIKEK